MVYTIKNKFLTVGISDMGGELQSIKSADGTEYLWQGNPEFWAGRAYNLFPIVGRLTEGKYTYKGKTYEMNLHGFVRKTVLAVLSSKEDAITFGLKANDTTKAMYPFDFEYTLAYALDKNTIKITYGVVNNGSDTMPFTVGAHPGFNVPFVQGEKFEDYYLEFADKKEVRSLILSPTCYITGKDEAFSMTAGKILGLKHNLFDNDAIVLSNVSDKVTLKSKTGSKSVTVYYPDMKYLGIWHKPKCEAPYVCIEPWAGLPAYDKVIDDIETKKDMVKLEKGKKYSNSHYITIK